MTTPATQPPVARIAGNAGFSRGRRWILVAVSALVGCQPATPPKPVAPTRAEAEAFVAGLDVAFSERRTDDYFAQFDLEEHPQFDAALRAFVRQMQKAEDSTATSRIQDYFVRGGLGVAHVVTTYRCAASTSEIVTALAMRRVADRTRGVFALEMDAPRFASLGSSRNRFACAACNYEISFDERWLAVPVPAVRSGCMESLWLVSLTHDVHLEVAVTVGEAAVPAETAMRHCLEAARERGQCTADLPLRIEPWQAPGWEAAATQSTASQTVPDFTGCQSRQRCPAGRDVQLYLLVSGRVRYMIAACGPEKELAAQREAIQTVLDSFRPIENSQSEVDHLQSVIFAHTGQSTLDEDNRFHNQKHRISLAGPRTWTGKLTPGRHEFELSFTCPDRAGHLRIIARRREKGWDRAAVESLALLFRGSCSRSVRDAESWRSLATGGFQVLDIRTAPDQGADPDHLRRFAFHQEILLICDATFPNSRSWTEIETCLASFRVDD